MLILEQMIVLFIIMIIGYIAYKKKIITDEAGKKLSAIVINIANPALILSGVTGDTGGIKGKDLAITVITAIVVYAVLIIIGNIIPKLLKIENKSIGTYKAMTVFSNIGFMGFPIISAVLGNEALLYAVIFLIPYNLLIYTYGISCIKKEKTSKEKAGKEFNINKVFNIGIIFCIIAILIYFFDLKLPAFAIKTVTYLSNLTMPLSMLVIGASFAVIDIKSLFTDIKLLIFSGIKLLVIPIAGTLLIRSVVDNYMLTGVCMFMLCMPIGSMTSMLAQEYDGDYALTVKGVAVTTALSVITIPIVSALTSVI